MFVHVFPLGIPPYVPVLRQLLKPDEQAAAFPPREMQPFLREVQLFEQAAA